MTSSSILSGVKQRRQKEEEKTALPRLFATVGAIVAAENLTLPWIRGLKQKDTMLKTVNDLTIMPKRKTPASLFFIGTDADRETTNAILRTIDAPYLQYATSATDIMYAQQLYDINPSFEPALLQRNAFYTLILGELAKKEITSIEQQSAQLKGSLELETDKVLQLFANKIGFSYSKRKREYMASLFEKLKLDHIRAETALCGETFDELVDEATKKLSKNFLAEKKLLDALNIETSKREWMVNIHYKKDREITKKALKKLRNKELEGKIPSTLEELCGKIVKMKPYYHDGYYYGDYTSNVPAGSKGILRRVRGENIVEFDRPIGRKMEELGYKYGCRVIRQEIEYVGQKPIIETYQLSKEVAAAITKKDYDGLVEALINEKNESVATQAKALKERTKILQELTKKIYEG